MLAMGGADGPVTRCSRMPLAVGVEKSTFSFRARVMLSPAIAMSPSPARSRGMSWSRATGMTTT